MKKKACLNCGCRAPHSLSGVLLTKLGLPGVRLYCLCGLRNEYCAHAKKARR